MIFAAEFNWRYWNCLGCDDTIIVPLANNDDVVAFKMAVGKARGGRDVTDEQRGRRPFSTQPSRQRLARALKNSQLTSGDITIICRLH